MNELERQKKVIDMMITAHSVLRDRYNATSSFFEILLLIASIILNALLFVDAKFIEKFTHLNDDEQKLIIGLSGLIVFIISIVMLQVSWREKATQHSIAADNLFSLKQECRNIIRSITQISSPEATILVEDFNRKYNRVLNDHVKIPDRKFNSLKLIHYRKVELSKLIDQHPNSRLWLLKIKLFYLSIKGIV